MASREILFDLSMALRILEVSAEDFEKKTANRPSSMCTKTNLEKVHQSLIGNFSSYYGIEYESLDFDRDYHKKNLKRLIKEVLGKQKESFVIGSIPEPAPRSRPKCKYNLTSSFRT